MQPLVNKKARSVLSFLFGLTCTALLLTASYSGYRQSTGIDSDPSETQPLSNDVPIRVQLEDLSDLVQFTRGFERTSALRQMLKSANAERVLELFEQSRSIETDDLRLASQREILRRLAEIDPTLALEQSRSVPYRERESLTRAVLLERSFSHFQDTVELAKSLNGMEQRVATEALLLAGEQLPRESRLKIAQMLGWEELALDLFEREAVELSSKDPEAAWHTLLEDERIDFNQVQSLLLIAEAWIERDPNLALASISETLEGSSIHATIVTPVFREMARSNPAQAFELARSMPSVANDYEILRPIVGIWSVNDPLKAVLSISELESGNVRRRLLQAALQEWARSEPRDLLEALSDLSPEVQMIGRKQALTVLAGEAPEEAARLMVDLDTQGIYDVGYAVANNWAKKDIRKTLEWILSEPREQELRDYLLSLVWDDVVREDAELAFETAVSLPSERFSPGPEVAVVKQVARTDIERAREMLPQVRGGISRIAAYSEVGFQYVLQDNVEQAFELCADLSDSQESNCQIALASEWAYHDPVGLLDVLERFPTPKVRSKAAEWLLTADRNFNKLSTEQIEVARSFVASSDANADQPSTP